MGSVTTEDLALIKLALQGILRMLGIAHDVAFINGMSQEELAIYMEPLRNRWDAVDDRLKAQ